MKTFRQLVHGRVWGFLFFFFKGQLVTLESAFLKGCEIKLREQALIFTQTLSVHRDFSFILLLAWDLKTF